METTLRTVAAEVQFRPLAQEPHPQRLSTTVTDGVCLEEQLVQAVIGFQARPQGLGAKCCPCPQYYLSWAIISMHEREVCKMNWFVAFKMPGL